MEILWVISSILLILEFTGYVNYRLGKAVTWEDGCMNILRYLGKTGRWLFDAVYEYLTGELPADKKIDTRFLLYQDEINALVEKFEDMPYFIPQLEGWSANWNGCFRVDIKAQKLVPAFEDISKEELKNMCLAIIQKFYVEVREMYPPIVIPVATSHHLSFVVPLTMQARDSLMKQAEEQRIAALKQELPSEDSTLNEEIIPDQTLPEEDDPWYGSGL